MEFFEEIKSSTPTVVDDLKKILVIKNFPMLCLSISSVISDNTTDGIVYCVWGEFEINREELKYGVRFSMPDCPNALMWSITIDDSAKNIIIHCTINKKEHEEDFIASIEEFINNWNTGIKRWMGSD